MLGYHAYVDKGISRAIENAGADDAEAIQIFFRSPRTLDPTPRKISVEDKMSRQNFENMVIMSHSPYIMNLATSKLTANSPVTRMLHDDLRCNDELGGIGTVIHLGSNTKGGTIESSMRQVVDNINLIIETYPDFAERHGIENPRAKLILENNARSGNKLFWEIDSLPPIVAGGDSIGYCLDTQHLFASGYNVTSTEVCRDLFRRFDNCVGENKLSVIHINDSAVALDGRKDEHMPLGEGHIWGKNRESLSFWAKKAMDLNIPLILETGKIDHSGEFDLLRESLLHQK